MMYLLEKKSKENSAKCNVILFIFMEDVGIFVQPSIWIVEFVGL